MTVAWYPATDSPDVVGYFDTGEKLDPAASREAGEYKFKPVTRLYHKVRGSGDVSTTEVKPAVKARLIARFPDAWKAFERGLVPKHDDGCIMPEGVVGTPIKDLGCGHQQVLLYNNAGIYTIEQMAEVGEAVQHNLGFGADKVIQRARDYVAEAEKPRRGRPPKVKEEA